MTIEKKTAPTETDVASLLAAAREAKNANAIIDYIPYARYLGITAKAVEPEKDEADQLLRRRYVLPFQEKLVGNTALPALHGGVVAGFAETAALVEVLMQENTQLRVPKSVDFSIDYVRSAGAVETFADCHIVRQGISVALVQINVWQQRPKHTVAAARVHFLLDGSLVVDNPEPVPQIKA